MAITKWDDLQLRFDLDLDEAEDDAKERDISPEDARMISEAARVQFNAKLNYTSTLTTGQVRPEWFDDFLMLREQGWPWRVACYIAWAGSPKVGRWPETLQELATEVLGLKSPRVVYTWRQKYKTIDTIVTMTQSKDFWEHRADVLKTLAEMAAVPDYKSHQDRKLYLEITQDYTPKSKLELGKSKGGEIDDLSDDELREWMGSNPEGSEREPRNQEEENAGE